ncbi:Fur family transcriptional regulator [Streptomyces sp. TS71-3]|uniref:Fur family transcriptional regulator n=1 Tax=Streptomyces sp. TS71-3 TaxID=2733862 RepID=UPI001B0645B9|nr:Fur family transcriptional regulator [Streptomyces sp. TS71-3]GHJ41228.1 transcriptional repressor [Streptomyces sp. TS71-3]
MGGRTTRQRTAVLRALAGSQDFVSARELYALLVGGTHTIGLTTVYRALRDLEDAGAVDVVRDERTAEGAQGGDSGARRPPGERGRLYRLRRADGHRHYLICRCCGRSQPLDSDVVEEWAARVAVDSGFAAVQHTVELTGLCADCHVDGEARAERPCHLVPGRRGDRDGLRGHAG